MLIMPPVSADLHLINRLAEAHANVEESAKATWFHLNTKGFLQIAKSWRHYISTKEGPIEPSKLFYLIERIDPFFLVECHLSKSESCNVESRSRINQIDTWMWEMKLRGLEREAEELIQLFEDIRLFLDHEEEACLHRRSRIAIGACFNRVRELGAHLSRIQVRANRIAATAYIGILHNIRIEFDDISGYVTSRELIIEN